MHEKSIEYLRQIIELTEHYADVEISPNTTYRSILQTSFRRNLQTIKAIYTLVTKIPNNPSVYSSEALALFRKILENYINILYIQFKGKEKYSDKLDKFSVVEKHKEYEIAKTLAITEEEQLRVEKYFEGLEEKYKLIPRKIRDRHNWVGKDTEELLNILKEAEKIDSESADLLIAIYNLCCQNLHVSVVNLTNYNSIEITKKALQFNLKILLKVSIDIFGDLAFQLMYEINPEDENIEILKDMKTKSRKNDA